MIKPVNRFFKSKIVTYDIETLGLVPKNFLYGVVNYGHSTKVFTDKHEMLNDMISRKNKGKVFFAHNCEFDLSGLIDQNLFKFFPNIKKQMDNPLYRGSNFIAAKYPIFEKLLGYNSDGTEKWYREYIRFWDSIRILQSSLDNIGGTLNYPKMKMPTLFYNKLYEENDPRFDPEHNEKYTYKEGLKIFYDNWNEVETQKYYIDYCTNDTKLLFKALTDFQEFTYKQYGVGLKPTISSIAFTIWKRDFNNMLWHDCNPQHNAAFKESFYGGHVDVYKWGKSKNVNYYDINSLYSFMGMKEYPHPFKLYHTTESKIYEKYEGCGLFEIKTPDMLIPILPYRYRGKLVFPNGEFKAWYNFNEIRYAVENGYEVDLIYGYFSYDRTSPLKDYFKSIYNHRLQYPKEHYFNLILKYLLNSLYGRFGLKIENKEYMYDYEYWNNKYRFEGWDFVTLSSDGYGYAVNTDDPYYFSESTYNAIPSYLTSYARIYLHKFLQKYQDNLLYCDTDSIFLQNKKIGDKYISTEMGDFKLEGNFNNGWFLGCKFYVLNDEDDYKVKIKGVRVRDKIKSITELPLEYTQNTYYKNRESLRRNKIAGSKKILKKTVNPLAFDKRYYDCEIDYRNECVDTYPMVINNL